MIALPPLLSLILTLAVLGFIVWLVTTYIPMPDVFKRTIIVVVIIAVLIWFGRIVGIF